MRHRGYSWVEGLFVGQPDTLFCGISRFSLEGLFRRDRLHACYGRVDGYQQGELVKRIIGSGLPLQE